MNQIDKLMYGGIISDAHHYKLAGNSVVVPVLEHIFKTKMDLPKDRPIKLFEFFAGYGSQHQALKNIGFDVEAYISEWYTEAVIAYALLHHFEEYTQLLKEYKNIYIDDLLLDFIEGVPFSTDSKNPSKNNLKTYKRKFELLLALRVTQNYGTINEITGSEIYSDRGEFDLFTWSFPCQDLSIAGKGAGMGTTETRSGLCWEFIRVLKEFKELDALPKYLLMENVPAIHNKKNIEDFNRLQQELREIGYENEWFDLNAKDYGIPQNRNRTFMVSVKKEK